MKGRQCVKGVEAVAWLGSQPLMGCATMPEIQNLYDQNGQESVFDQGCQILSLRPQGTVTGE
jgi:hypothetical protein